MNLTGLKGCSMNSIKELDIKDLIAAALKEDIGSGDVTSALLIKK